MHRLSTVTDISNRIRNIGGKGSSPSICLYKIVYKTVGDNKITADVTSGWYDVVAVQPSRYYLPHRYFVLVRVVVYNDYATETCYSTLSAYVERENPLFVGIVILDNVKFTLYTVRLYGMYALLNITTVLSY